MSEGSEPARWAPSASVDEYIGRFDSEIQEKLQSLRGVIREAAPEAAETINYRMPTFVLHGNLVHFAAQKKHIGFYPTPSGIAAFQAELAGYKSSKGAVQFPLDQPLPLELIGRIVAFRVAENVRLAEEKAAKSPGQARSRANEEGEDR